MSTLSRRNLLKTTAVASIAALPTKHGLAAPSEEDPLGVRSEFPVTGELAYLNTASLGPLSRTVRDTLVAYADEKMLYRNPGSRRESKERARAKFASLFGADTDEIAFLYSTSDGENVVVNSMDWKAGDNVVLDELHFTTSFVLYRELETRRGRAANRSVSRRTGADRGLRCPRRRPNPASQRRLGVEPQRISPRPSGAW